MTDLIPDIVDDDEELDLDAIRRTTEWRDMDERERFLLLLFRGYGQMNAAFELGWSPAKLRRLLAQPDFAELVDIVEQRKNECIERTLFLRAKAGNMDAVKLWVFNRDPARWRDVRRIEVTQDTTVSVQIVRSVAATVGELMREQGAKALQPGGVLDDIIDAEVVDDRDG